MRRLSTVILGLTALVGLAACGGSGSGAVSVPKVAPAGTYRLQNFQPAAPVVAGRPTVLSFTIQQPSGQPLSAYRKCCEPHAGVDLIIVRADDSHVQYDDSDIGSGGHVSQPVVFPTPGRYRVVVDAYPAHTTPDQPLNFQLFTWVTVKGAYHPRPVPAYTPTVTSGGYRFQIQGHPSLKAIQATFLTIRVTGPGGRLAVFESWRGALAHAIFIHQGSLDYFHTHVCSPGASYCTSVLGAARVTGSSSGPGVLHVGVLLPEPGTWRLFLLTHIGGRYLTAPFTLKASA
ncbi:MAG TPA: hypothetical protein VKR21_03570 [Solirubrobacteraceae bacterium]|nr:hypothetical protein [Solirubrobacteraceae bacterium]